MEFGILSPYTLALRFCRLCLGANQMLDSRDSILERATRGDREAMAQFVMRIEPLVRRRISGKLGARMRRVFDSHDIFSTVVRRVDQYVANHEIRATSEAQLTALVLEVANKAVIDKVRMIKRLEETEKDPRVYELLRRSTTVDHDPIRSERLLERVFSSNLDNRDSQILWLWLSGTELRVIAEMFDMTPEAIRQRWARLRAALTPIIADELSR